MQFEILRPADPLYMKITIEDPKIELHSDVEQVEVHKCQTREGIKLSNHKGIKGETYQIDNKNFVLTFSTISMQMNCIRIEKNGQLRFESPY